MESPVKILAAGLDTLVLNIYPTDLAYQVTDRRVDKELQEELMELKERAQHLEEDIVTRFVFDGVPLLMTRKGEKGFQWILRNSKLAVAVNRGSKMNLLAQVRCSSEYLWSVRDPGAVISQVHVFLMSMFGDYIIPDVSNCDLAVDVAGLDLTSVEEVKRHFVTRAQLGGQMPLSAEVLMVDGPDQIKTRWGRLTGFPFGARGGAVSALIYDKTHEITYKSPEKRWFRDLWLQAKDEEGQPLWDGESTVWRIELRFKREALNEMKQERVVHQEGEEEKVETVFHGISDAYSLEEHLPGLWAYGVGHVGGGPDGLPDGWLRYVVPTADTNRSRWPVHPDWQVIQGAFLPQPVPESDYEREEREKEELLQLVDAELAARPWKNEKKVRRRRHAASSPAPAPLPVIELRPYIRRRKYRENMKRLVAQIAGTAITAEAWRAQSGELSREDIAAPDLSVTFHFLYGEVENYLAEKSRDFEEEVAKRRAKRSVEKVTAVA